MYYKFGTRRVRVPNLFLFMKESVFHGEGNARISSGDEATARFDGQFHLHEQGDFFAGADLERVGRDRQAAL